MQINSGNLDSLFVGINSAFKSAVTAKQSDFPVFAKSITSSSGAESYPFGYVTGGMKEWIGSYELSKVELKSMKVHNRDFKDALSVNRNDIEDDQIGVYSMLAQSLGTNAASLWSQLAFDALLANDKWADDASFFGTTRMLGKSKIENKGTSGLNEATFLAARAKMRGYKHPNGTQSLGVNPDLLVVGPALEVTAKALMEDQWAVSAEGAAVPNKARGYCKVVVVDE